MKNIFRFLTVSILLTSLVSCGDSDSNTGSNITTFTAVLNGANEVPTNNSTATGTATLQFDNTTKIFSLVVTHNLTSATSGHIHVGAAGTNGSVVFPLTDLTSPISYTSAALTAIQEADLKANLYYVNLHSTAFTDGEIRGQLIKGETKSGSSGGGY